MLVHHSFDHRFVILIERLRKIYGEKMIKISGIGDADLDINAFSKKFFSTESSIADKSVDGNANVSDYSIISWDSELAKPIKRLNSLYILWKNAMGKYGIKRANKMVEYEIKGAIRIHDLHLFSKAYCWASSLERLVSVGMPFVSNIKIGPIKWFDSFINVSLQYICYASNQIAGAIALSDFFVYCDYFVRKTYGENWFADPGIVNHVNQEFQSWIYSVNFSWRSNQPPFTNLSIFDRHWMKALFENHVNPDYSKPNFENMMKLQIMFVKEMIRNLKDNPYTFPVMTAALLYDETTKEFKDKEFEKVLCELNADTGLFNFFIDSQVNSLSSCCRLRSNIEEANKEYTNSFGAGGVSVGSHRVVTVNLPHIAYKVSGNWEEFKKNLEYTVAISQDILDVHHSHLIKLIEEKRLPLYTFGFMDLKKQFSTIGFIGLNECLEIFGENMLKEAGQKKATEILDTINELNLRRSKNDGRIRNIEQIPGESAAFHFAQKDAILYDSHKNYPLYSNQYIPLSSNVGIEDRIKIQGMYDSKCGGGAILHINLQDAVSPIQMEKILNYCAKNGVKYFAINYNFSQCTSCKKVFIGKMEKSPCHNAPVKKFLRIVGFLGEVSNWAKERQDEYDHRQFYKDIKRIG